MRVTFPTFPTWTYHFPEKDVKRISAVTYYDATNEQQELPADKYRLAISRHGVSALVWRDKPGLPATATRIDAVNVEYET